MSKKEFRGNLPILQNVSRTAQTERTPDAQQAAPSYTPIAQETKSKRLNLLIQPSLHEQLSKIAYVERVSLNELILRVAREYANQKQDAIQKYDEFTGANKE